MILGKNRSREMTGFGSPTLRKVNLEKEKSKDAFDNIMAKHGLLNDLNNLNSFNAFCKQSPLRHQRSLDYCYQSTNSSLYPKIQDGKHMKTCTQHQVNFNTRTGFNGSPNSILSQFSPEGVMQNKQEVWETADSKNGGYSFPFQRRARSASPPKDPEVKEKIASTLSPRHTRENNTSAVDDMLEDQLMGIQDPLKSQNSIHSRIGSGSFKNRKPIVANTNLIFGGNVHGKSNRGSATESNNVVSSDKMKVLNKAINYYLNGEYNKIMDEEQNTDPKLIENDLCTHDLKDHEIPETNEHDTTDEGITKKWDVDDWLCDDNSRSNADENSLESKDQNGFDPFSQPPLEDYNSQRNLYKNRRNSKNKGKVDTDREMTNESIMQIIENSQKADEKQTSNNQKYISLVDKNEPQVEKNVIVDDADLELENCLEGEEWMFKTFNRKKQLEEKAQQETENIEKEEIIEEAPIECQKPPQPAPKPKLENSSNNNEKINNMKAVHTRNASAADCQLEENKPKRKKKNSRHRRTASKTFDQEFFKQFEAANTGI